MRFLVVGFGLLLLVSPIAMLAVLRWRDSQRWTMRVFAERWRAAPQNIRAAIVILGTRWVGFALIGLSLVLSGFGADGIPPLNLGIVFVIGSVAFRLIGGIWSWMRRRRQTG